LILTELRICDFRNLALVHVEPSARFNVIEGNNGQGKTNLLEAIYLLGALKSFRASINQEMVRFESQQADIRGVVGHEGAERVLRMTVKPRARRLFIDGKSSRNLADSLGQLRVVLFAPEDLSITKGSPSGRRKFLDRAVFNRWPGSLADMRRYDDGLKQRNALLRDDGPDSLLEVFDEQVAEAAARVVSWRQRYLAEYIPIFVDSLAEATGGELTGDLSYVPKVEANDAESFVTALRTSRRKDRARRTTSLGPHVDDLYASLDGRSARSFASQGQHRAFVLAMKIAEIRVLQAGLGFSPLLLLDDVSSELDAGRNAHLMRYLAGDSFGGQVFLTTTDRAHVRIDSDFSCFTIRAGDVERRDS
jgi:DNA replication and repair protein RecF